MRLGRGEPEAGPWRLAPFAELVGTVLHQVAVTDERPRVVAVDGRSGSGKTTLASRLCSTVAGSAVVHTDDVAWHHAMFDWADLMRTGVLAPLRRGEPVDFRPPAWRERGRPGAIRVSGGAALVVVEGVGAARRDLADLVDAVVWVQADLAVAESRGVARDGGDAAAAAFWDEWQREEVPFLAGDRPWERADVVVCGTPDELPDPGRQVVLGSPPVSRGGGQPAG